MSEASPLLQTAPALGAASSFVVLAGSSVTNTGATTVSADLGVSPGSAVTGFPPGTVTGGSIHAADALAGRAQADTTTAYNNLTSQPCTRNLTGQDLGGLTLIPGVYCFSSSAQLTGTLTLNAQGSGSAVFVFLIGSTLTTASNSVVAITNSGSACNVFWQVGTSATLGTTTSFIGNILALTSITLNTGANVVGRALARNGAVSMDTNQVGSGGCAVGAPTPTATLVLPPTTATATATTAAATATATATAATAAAPATATATATATAATVPSPAAPGPFVPTKPAPTANLPLTTPAALVAATAVPPATPTGTALSVTQPAAVGGAVAAATPPAGTSSNAVTAPAPNTASVAFPPAATPIPTAVAPPAQLPSALPNTGSGPPPLGVLSLLLGGLAMAGALGLRRTRK